MRSIRTFAERMSRGVVLKRRLPLAVGGSPIFVSPDAALRFWRHDLARTDPALFHWAAELIHSGDVVWDIGASVGLFTFAAANLAAKSGRVLAVEPDTWQVDILRRSARLNSQHRAPVDILPVAVTNLIGVAQFVVARRGRSSSHLLGAESSQAGGCRESQQVLTVTLDWLMHNYTPPTLVKIDVEGAEDLVLSGGEELLSVVRPTLLCEVSDGCAGAVTNTLRRHGYALFDADLQPHVRQPLGHAVWNTLARPQPAQSRDQGSTR